MLFVSKFCVAVKQSVIIRQCCSIVLNCCHLSDSVCITPLSTSVISPKNIAA